MADRQSPRFFVSPSLSQEQEASPKRKRVGSTEVSAAQHDPQYRRLHLPKIERVPMPERMGYASGNDQPIMNTEVEEFLRCCNNRFTLARAQQERSELTVNGRILNSITATQVTQARTGNDLLKLTNELHDFARSLNEQERYLHQELAKLNQQKLEFNNKLLDATVNQMRATLSLSQTSPASLQAAQDENTQLKTKVGHLEYQINLNQTTMENLFSERMMQEEARKYAQAKLRGAEAELRRLQATGHVLVSYPMPDEGEMNEGEMDGDEMDEYIPMKPPRRAACCSGPPPAECVMKANQKYSSTSPPPFPAFFYDYPSITPLRKDGTIGDRTSPDENLNQTRRSKHLRRFAEDSDVAISPLDDDTIGNKNEKDSDQVDSKSHWPETAWTDHREL